MLDSLGCMDFDAAMPPVTELSPGPFSYTRSEYPSLDGHSSPSRRSNQAAGCVSSPCSTRIEYYSPAESLASQQSRNPVKGSRAGARATSPGERVAKQTSPARSRSPVRPRSQDVGCRSRNPRRGGWGRPHTDHSPMRTARSHSPAQDTDWYAQNPSVGGWDRRHSDHNRWRQDRLTAPYPERWTRNPSGGNQGGSAGYGKNHFRNLRKKDKKRKRRLERQRGADLEDWRMMRLVRMQTVTTVACMRGRHREQGNWPSAAYEGRLG